MQHRSNDNSRNSETFNVITTNDEADIHQLYRSLRKYNQMNDLPNSKANANKFKKHYNKCANQPFFALSRIIVCIKLNLSV